MSDRLQEAKDSVAPGHPYHNAPRLRELLAAMVAEVELQKAIFATVHEHSNRRMVAINELLSHPCAARVRSLVGSLVWDDLERARHECFDLRSKS